MVGTERKLPKARKDAKIMGKGLGQYLFLDSRGILEKGITVKGVMQHYWIVLTKKSRSKRHIWRRKKLLNQEKVPVHTSMKAMAKLDELNNELLHHPPNSPYLAPETIICFLT